MLVTLPSNTEKARLLSSGIASTELNIVAGIGIAAAICRIFTGISHAVKRKTRVSVLTIILFALQIISAWMLGFVTVV